MPTISNLNSNGSQCICSLNPNCLSSVGFYNSNLVLLSDQSNVIFVYEIPGLVAGCSTMKSLLFSTLECFYSNSECFSIVLNYIKQIYMWNVEQPEWFDISPLIYNSNIDHFPPNTILLDIIQNVTIEQWNVSFSYENFYETCAPIHCIYTIYTHEKSSIEIIQTFLSLISGLVFLLRFLTPYLVLLISNCLRKRNNRQQIEQQSTFRFVELKRKIRLGLKSTWEILVNLNIFARRDLGNHTNEMTRKSLGQWSTRLYFSLLVIGLVSLGLYSIIQPVIQTKYFSESTFDFYNKFYREYGDALKCSCQLISSKYDEFVSIEPEFHEVIE